jgi:hypothetical protein
MSIGVGSKRLRPTPPRRVLRYHPAPLACWPWQAMGPSCQGAAGSSYKRYPRGRFGSGGGARARGPGCPCKAQRRPRGKIIGRRPTAQAAPAGAGASRREGKGRRGTQLGRPLWVGAGAARQCWHGMDSGAPCSGRCAALWLGRVRWPWGQPQRRHTCQQRTPHGCVAGLSRRGARPGPGPRPGSTSIWAPEGCMALVPWLAKP